MRTRTHSRIKMYCGFTIVQHGFEDLPIPTLNSRSSAGRHGNSSPKSMDPIHIRGILSVIRRDQIPVLYAGHCKSFAHVDPSTPFHDFPHPSLTDFDNIQSPFLTPTGGKFPTQPYTFCEVFNTPRGTLLAQPNWVVKLEESR